MILGYIPQYGTLTQIGTVDFYPGTGKGAYGCYQPGCYDVFDIVACSHSRSHDYYLASIQGPYMFIPDNFNNQIYPSDLLVLFLVNFFYRSNLPLLFMVKSFNRTFFVVTLKSTSKFNK